MKKTLSIINVLKVGLSLFVDLALFIYLVVISAVGGTNVFSLILAWFLWAAAVVLSVLIVKNFKKPGTERDLKMQIYFSFALMLVGVFLLDIVNTLMLVLFALTLVEYMIREKSGGEAEEQIAKPELPAEQTYAAPEDEGGETAVAEPEAQSKPVRKVIAPKRRGDDAVPPEDGAQSEE